MKKRLTTIAEFLGWCLIPMALIVWMSGCTRTVYTPIHSSVRVVDTITRVEPDSSVLRALFECDSNNQVVMRELVEHKGKTASQEVAFDKGELRVETRWKTQYIDRFKEIHDTITVVEFRDVVREVKHVPTFFWWLLGLNVLAVGGWAVRRLLKHGV